MKFDCLTMEVNNNMRVNAKLIVLFIILAVVFAAVVGIVSATPGNGNGNDCQGNSCEDVPGNECENGEHVGNPHCDPEDTDDPGDDDEDCPGSSCDDVPGDECENGQHEGNPHCDDQDDPGDDDECPVDSDNCPPDDDDDEDDCVVNENCPPDDGDDDTPRDVPSTSQEPAGPQCPTDVFHPFLANQDGSVSFWAAGGFNPAAQAYLVGNAEWAGEYTDLSSASYTQLHIVPADYDATDRDTVRSGNDAGILCTGVLPSGPQIIAFVVDGVVAGIVQVEDFGSIVVIHHASILRWDLLTQDPLFGGDWDYGDEYRPAS